MKKIIILCMAALTLMACGKKNQGNSLPDELAEQYNQVYNQVTSLKQMLQNPDQLATIGGIAEVKNITDSLAFDYDATGLDSADIALCEQLKKQIPELKSAVCETLEDVCKTYLVYSVQQDEYLMQKTELFPVYLEKGDKLFIDIDMEKPADIKVYNADSHALLKTFAKKTNLHDSIAISFKAVYLVQINPKETQYANIHLSYRAANIDRMVSPKTVKTETEEGKAGDFLVESIKGIKMQNLFEEPRKFTLRGQLKAAFSGSYRGVVAIQVPSGASDILYSLRISTNEGDRYSDGKFHDNMETSYKRVKMLGLPVYESHKGAGIIATLLGDNQPPREEDAYINLYVFYDAGQARKFQDGGDPAKIKYNIDYSKMGTQSCNDRIPTREYKTVYLGFLNERVRYNNYVWLEAVSAVPTTEYFKPKFTLDE